VERNIRILSSQAHTNMFGIHYFAVVMLILDWWLLLDYIFLLLSTILLLLWFNFVVAPFGERTQSGS